MLVAIALAVGCTGGGGDEGGAGTNGDVAGIAGVGADELLDKMEALASALPTEPLDAVAELVTIVHRGEGDSPLVAVAELLRRAGLPLVDGDGPVLALPDGDLVLADGAVYYELLPLLTRAVRSGDSYSLDQLSQILTSTDFTTELIPGRQLAAILGTWAQEPAAREIFMHGAATVRALAASRGHVLYSGSDPEATTIDPLQTAIVIAHATSRVVYLADGAAGLVRDGVDEEGMSYLDRLLGVRPAAAQELGLCEALNTFLKTENSILKIAGDEAKGRVIDAAKAKVFTDPARLELFNKAGEAYSKGAASLNAILLMLGARIDIKADKTSTHFKHEPGSRAEHVHLTAHATFDVGIAKEKLHCYALAGLEVPPPGPLKDFTVRWATFQPQGLVQQGNKFLVAVSADSNKFDNGSRTDGNGETTLELKPPYEVEPAKGKELKGSVTVKASLDKENFPFELGDLVGLFKNPLEFAAGKSFDLVRELLTKAGLPNQYIALQVGYHATDIFVAKGNSNVFLGFYEIPDVYVDVYSCSGIEGPWRGVGGITAPDLTALGDIANAGLSALGLPNYPPGVPVELPVADFNAPVGQFTRFDIIPDNGFMQGMLYLAPDDYGATEWLIVDQGGDRRVGRPVGEVEILLAGNEWPFNDLTFPVSWVPADARCPGGEFRYDDL